MTEIRPDYYKKKGIEVWDIIDAYDLDFYEANAVKYVLRWREKGGVEDLKKAITYIQRIIDREQSPDEDT